MQRFKESRALVNATVAAADSPELQGYAWGDYNQLFARLQVATCTGGADTLDVKIQTLIGEDWIDLTDLVFTQVTAAATGETKIALRSSSVAWTDRLRAVIAPGAGATATGVYLSVYAAHA
jgi:hypothetical protein